MIDAKKLQSAMNKNAKEAKHQLEVVRKDIQQIDDELYWLENAPLPLGDALDKVSRFVKDHSTSAGIDHFFHARSLGSKGLFDSEVTFKHGELRAHEHGTVIGSGMTDISTIICSLFGSNVEQVLQNIAKEASKNIESGPPLAERPQLRTKLLTRQHIAEEQEEKIICSAEALGLRGFYRRADCNPEIILMTNKAEHDID